MCSVKLKYQCASHQLDAAVFELLESWKLCFDTECKSPLPLLSKASLRHSEPPLADGPMIQHSRSSAARCVPPSTRGCASVGWLWSPTEERWSLEAGGRHQPVWIEIFLVFASFSPFLTQKTLNVTLGPSENPSRAEWGVSVGIKLRMSSNPNRSRLMTHLVSWMDHLSLGSVWSVSACSTCHVVVSVCAHRGQFHHLHGDGVFFNWTLSGHLGVKPRGTNRKSSIFNWSKLRKRSQELSLLCFCYYHGSETKKTVFIVVNNAFVPMDHHHQGAGAVSWSSQTRLTGFSGVWFSAEKKICNFTEFSCNFK